MKPAVLLLHAFPLDARMWTDTIASFALPQIVLAPNAADLLAEGASIASMARVARSCVGSEPFVPVGVSMGGYIALEMVRQFPEQVTALVLCDTKASADTPEAKAGRDSLMAEVCAHGVVQATQAMLSRLVAPGASREIKEKLRAIVADQEPQTVMACALAMRDREDNTHLLPRISVPTLVIRGEEDLLMTRETTLEMAEAIPGGRWVSLAGCGHLPPLEQPGEFNTVLHEFLR